MHQKNQKNNVNNPSPGLKNKPTTLLPEETSEDSLTPHIPVLLSEVLQYLDPKEGESYLDLTAGYGGHAEKILGITKANTRATLIDRDPKAIEHLQNKFQENSPTIIKNDFWRATEELVESGQQFDLILADLGVSSPHLDMASRGFSISADGPLDMRMDQSQQLTAEKVVNSYSVEELARILKEYGEEPKAWSIARMIVANRPFATTSELAKVVARAWSGPATGKSRRHPAVRTFQALRIAVNNELEQVKNALPLWCSMLTPGGRIVVISFHSLEDKIVKQGMRELAGDRYDASLRELTHGPITAGEDELVFNPRARSAKLRAAAKIKI
jgi:16S rRNA (cytosine1402-N4)-methyltransferase